MIIAVCAESIFRKSREQNFFVIQKLSWDFFYLPNAMRGLMEASILSNSFASDFCSLTTI